MCRVFLRRVFMRRVFLLMFAFVCVGALLFFAVPQPRIHAAVQQFNRPPCYGSSCYNHDPYTGSDAACGKTISHTVIGYMYSAGNGTKLGYVKNFYSRFCNANWVEGGLYGQRTGLEIFISANLADETMCYPENSCSNLSYYYGHIFPAWTNMVDGTDVTFGVGKYVNGPIDGGANQ